jgi:hypothetical protein
MAVCVCNVVLRPPSHMRNVTQPQSTARAHTFFRGLSSLSRVFTRRCRQICCPRNNGAFIISARGSRIDRTSSSINLYPAVFTQALGASRCFSRPLVVCTHVPLFHGASAPRRSQPPLSLALPAHHQLYPSPPPPPLYQPAPPPL